MKGYAALITLLMTATIAQAQQRTLPPEAQQKAGDLLKQLQQQSDLSKAVFRLAIGGAWWTNAELAARLGLTDEQKATLQERLKAADVLILGNDSRAGQKAVLLRVKSGDRTGFVALSFAS